MKKNYLSVAVVCLLGCILMTTSCIGSFNLTNRLLTWNKTVSSKFVNELVFLAFWVLPVYEVSALADVLVLNTIEFWSGTNPMASNSSRTIQGTDGRQYVISQDRKGYTIKDLSDNSTVRLDFDTTTQTWSMVTPTSDRHDLFTFIDDTHIQLPGASSPVELSPAGVNDYRHAVATSYALAAR